MGFTMHAFGRMHNCRRQHRWVLAVLLGMATLLPLQPAVAEHAFTIKYIETNLVDGVYQINAKIEFGFSEAALNALESGVPLLILFDLQVKKERWYLNKTVARLEQGYLLLYHALSEKFIIHNLNSGVQEHYNTLNAALSSLGQIKNLPVIDANLLEPDSDYLVRLRTHLDIESLPAPMRPLAYISSEWDLDSDWYTWPLTR